MKRDGGLGRAGEYKKIRCLSSWQSGSDRRASSFAPPAGKNERDEENKKGAPQKAPRIHRKPAPENLSPTRPAFIRGSPLTDVASNFYLTRRRRGRGGGKEKTNRRRGKRRRRCRRSLSNYPSRDRGNAPRKGTQPSRSWAAVRQPLRGTPRGRFVKGALPLSDRRGVLA